MCAIWVNISFTTADKDRPATRGNHCQAGDDPGRQQQASDHHLQPAWPDSLQHHGHQQRPAQRECSQQSLEHSKADSKAPTWPWCKLCGISGFPAQRLEISEPGIRSGNKDSRGTENRKSLKKYLPWKKIDKHTLFSMKIKIMDLWMQIEGTKLIFIMNFSVLGFKFASRMPQITQISLDFKIFGGGGGDTHPPPPPPPPPRNFLSFFFSLAIPGSGNFVWIYSGVLTFFAVFLLFGLSVGVMFSPESKLYWVSKVLSGFQLGRKSKSGCLAPVFGRICNSVNREKNLENDWNWVFLFFWGGGVFFIYIFKKTIFLILFLWWQYSEQLLPLCLSHRVNVIWSMLLCLLVICDSINTILSRLSLFACGLHICCFYLKGTLTWSKPSLPLCCSCLAA